MQNRSTCIQKICSHLDKVFLVYFQETFSRGKIYYTASTAVYMHIESIIS